MLAITLTQLEYIIAVDTYRHFVTASEKCFVTQPTLSMQIKKIEAAAHKDNMASNKILEKIGLTFTDTYLEGEIVWNWYEMNAAEYHNTKP